MSERSKRASTAAKSAASEAQSYLRELAKEDKAKMKAAVADISTGLGDYETKSIAEVMHPYMNNPETRARYERMTGKPYVGPGEGEDDTMGMGRRRRKTKKAGRRKSKKAGRRSTRRRRSRGSAGAAPPGAPSGRSCRC